ncbi:MAG: hypothetical protein LC117_06985 [Bacteroidia bacterium]|nr:hypothetical protein [Bacteroidia bacterium]
MDGLSISPLRGLLALWISSGYSLFIPSGLKKMTLETNHENTKVICHFGFKILFDGYLTATSYSISKALKINGYLFDGYLIKEKL